MLGAISSPTTPFLTLENLPLQLGGYCKLLFDPFPTTYFILEEHKIEKEKKIICILYVCLFNRCVIFV